MSPDVDAPAKVAALTDDLPDLEDRGPERSEGGTKHLTPRPAAASPKLSDGEYTAEYLAWYGLYPRKVGKDAGFLAWKRLIRKPGVTVEILTAGLMRWKVSEDWRDAEQRYLPHPATFLNDGRWKDSPAPASDSGLALVPDLQAGRPYPPDLEGKPWLGVWLEKRGRQPEPLTVMNLATALGVDPYDAVKLYRSEGLAAAGDWVWDSRKTG